MLRLQSLLLLLLASVSFSSAQNTIQVTIAESVPVEYRLLRAKNDSIGANNIVNEKLIDLVEVNERDPKVPTWYTTHQGGGFGWFIRMIGYWWQAVDKHRYKFVGTAKGGVSLPEEDQLTEHDINFNLVPHLDKYLNFVYRGRTEQRKHKYNFKRARHADVTKPPYVEPTVTTAEAYDLHCELTPPKRLRDSLNSLFYPCLPGPNLGEHPNFCDAHPTVGMYGVFVLDCNHSCHPEIHPYEWLWWLDLGTKGGEVDPKAWMFGFMKESSDRFVLWTRAPRVGSISIPFLFKTSEVNSSLNIQHLVTGKFMQHGLKKLKSVPAETNTFNFTDSVVQMQLPDGQMFPLQLHSSKPVRSQALRWWFSNVQTDANKEWIWGNLNIAVSVRNAYAARVTAVTR